MSTVVDLRGQPVVPDVEAFDRPVGDGRLVEAAEELGAPVR